jgi:Zn-dependent protease
MFFTLAEFIDLILMTVGVGFIFMDFFTIPRVVKFDWRALGWACLVTAPAVILHELAHKFTAMAFGVDATFHAAYLFLALGIVLKLVRSPFIFFVPGYVTIPAALPLLPMALTAFAGPALNGILYLLAVFVMENKRMQKTGRLFWMFTRRINGLLFVMNMLPLPGFDGLKVYQALFGLF